MITKVAGPTLDPCEIHPGLADHQAQLILRCSYLGASVRHGLTNWFAYQAAPGDQVELFGILVDHAEEVRLARRRHGPLVCRNIALLGPHVASQAQLLMEMPVWLARNLYAPVQLVVDRFWIDVGRKPRPGRTPLPHVPVSYFMVRCGIARRDRVIVAPRPPDELATLRNGPGDDGRDVFAAPLGRRPDNHLDAWNELATTFPL